AGRRLERADVPPLAADDPTLHLIGGEGHRRHRALRGGLGGEPLDREREDLLGFLVGALARLLLQVTGEGGGVVAGLILEPAKQLLLPVLSGDAGDLLRPGPRLPLLR